MIFFELIYNLSLLVALSIVSGFINKKYPQTSLNGKIIQGFLFGLVAIAGMMKPLVFTHGIIFDGRSVVISLCTLFFGPVSGIISGIISIIFRSIQGGSGILPGVLVILSSIIIGIGFHSKREEKESKITVKYLLAFGLLVHIAMLIMMFSLPLSTALSVIKGIGIPVMLVYPLATVLIGKILSDQEINQRNYELIKANELKFRTVADFTYDWEYWENEKKEIIYISPSCERISGYTQEEFIKNPKLLEKIIYPDDLPAYNNHRNEVFSSSNKDVSYELEYKIISKNGSVVDIYHACRPIYDENNKYLGRRVSNRDITERKKADEELRTSESKFRSIAETLTDVLFITSDRGMITFISKSSEKIFGYKPEEMNGHFFSDYLDANEQARILPMFYDTIKKGENHPQVVLTALKKDGTSFIAELSSSLIVRDKIVTGTIGLIRDITERKYAEKKLELYQDHLEELVKIRTKELDMVNESLKVEIGRQKEYEMMLKESLEKEKELNEMKSRFISTTSHEFRTPLTSILLSADLMKLYDHSWNEYKKIEYLDKIKNSVKYLTKLLDDMLTLSRTESGKITFQPEQVNIFSLAKECVDDVKSLLNEKHNLNVSFKTEQKEFNLDPKLMRFILNNLLSNAIKFSPDGGDVNLKIGSDSDKIYIEVSDMGIGIPPEDINKIFESFYRTKSAELMSGTGLGLAIVKRAIDLHYGEIGVTSELNKGTTFFVSLPQEVSSLQLDSSV